MQTYDNIFITTEKLPNTLPKDELLILLKEMRKGNIEAKNKIIMHNMRLVVHIIKHRLNGCQYDQKELLSIGIIGLIKAIETYDETFNTTFATYATKCIYNEILLSFRKNKYEIHNEDLDKKNFFIEDNSEDFTEKYEEYELYQAINEEIEKLPTRDREIIKLYYGFSNKSFSQKQIAEKFSCSHSLISYIIQKNIRKIACNLERRGLIELKRDKIEKTIKRKRSHKVEDN